MATKEKKSVDPASLSTGSLSKEAIMDVAVVALFVDGDATQEEGEMMGGTIAAQQAFAGVTGEEIRTMMDASIERLKAFQGPDDTIADITKRIGTDMSNRAAAFGIAYAIACADGIIAESEDSFLSALADSFGLGDDIVAKMISSVDEAMGRSGGEQDGGEEDEEEDDEDEDEDEDDEDENEQEEAPKKKGLSKRKG